MVPKEATLPYKTLQGSAVSGFERGWIWRLRPPFFEEATNKKVVNDFEYYDKNKGKHSELVCHFYFLALLV